MKTFVEIFNKLDGDFGTKNNDWLDQAREAAIQWIRQRIPGCEADAYPSPESALADLLSAKDEQIESLAKDRQNLEGSFSEAKANFKKLLEEQAERCSHLAGELQKAQVCITHLQTAVEEQTAVIAAKTSKVEQLEEKNDQLESSLANAERGQELAQERADRYRHERDTSIARCQEYSTERNKLRDRLALLSGQLEMMVRFTKEAAL